ncbi:SLC13/DASS family transporter [Alteromonas sp. 5E99-2]|nr:SLC13 family permease [Alteromonas sp. 5E99-2]MBO1254918.1 SLC13/DASS family transporter [Alteromonas sp. 5E99-2]
MTASLTVLIAVFWVTEALPIPVTSIIPFFAFPMTGILTAKQAASAMGSHVILLLMGAFMLSKAIEKSGVHERLALSILHRSGAKSSRALVLSFMCTAAFLSMWISNTATTLMLLPIALAVLKRLKTQALAPVLLLSIAYAASLGGVGTPIGTPPNIIMISIYEESLGTVVSFLDWMKTGVPVVIIGIPVMALWLTRKAIPLGDFELPELRKWTVAEKRVLMVFAIIACAWITRPYWTGALNLTTVNDSTIALAGVVLMCLIPSGGDEKDSYLLDWNTAQNIPWGMLLLFAGGICLAKAFTESGLSALLGEQLSYLSNFHIFITLLILCLGVSFLTEITSNTATATLLMPILASAGVAMKVDPALLMIPAAMSASCAFMMPVATAPNAIVYGSGKIPIQQMVKEGAILNCILAVVVVAVVWAVKL